MQGARGTVPWPPIAMTGHTDMPRLAHMPTHHGALSTALVASRQATTPVCTRARRRSWAGRKGWALRVGGKCGLVLQARWGGHGSLTLSPPGSSGPGHRILLVTETETHCPPVPRLGTHGDGCAPGTTGQDPCSLTACRHKWRRCTSWVPRSHGLGRWWQVEGSLGALSASLLSDLSGKVPGCGVAAPLILGALQEAYTRGRGETATYASCYMPGS